MGKRLAESGYSVLVINPFYRHAKVPVFADGAGFGDIREKVGPMRAAHTPEAITSDAKALVSFLDQQSSVDTGRKIPVVVAYEDFHSCGDERIRLAARDALTILNRRPFP